MNILITGGTGFIGLELTKFFFNEGHNLIILSRGRINVPNARIINSIEEINLNEKIDVIINLAGASINKRWNDSYKNLLINSRLEVTNNLLLLVNSLKTKPDLLISASAIGYYGAQNNEYIDEESTVTNDFSHKLCDLWEKEAKKIENIGVRTCITRLGVVLGKGGMLKQTLPIFKLGLGGKIGSGEQFFSWVHIDDIKHAFDFFIKDTSQKGVYNLTSPKPCSNYIFTKKLGRVINRPTIFAVPSYIIKIIFGEMG
ncbi:MAG: TIGR01777 family oxidoreductase, partial [Rickettsiaceae bacterium]|nr:TIGR01777 family oxidoreductase [Rickettsiaceae bacterium]